MFRDDDQQAFHSNSAFGEVKKDVDESSSFTEFSRTLHKSDLEDPVKFEAFANGLLTLRSPFIVQVTDVKTTDEDITICTEHVEKQSFGSYVEQVRHMGLMISEERLWDVLTHSVLGLHFLHTNNIFSGNLKPHDIFFVNEFMGKISDFYLFNHFKDPLGKAQEKTGNLGYLSPEQLNGQKATEKSDIWSLGLIFWEASSLRMFMEDNSTLDQAKQAVKEDVPMIDSSSYSDEWKNLIHQMLLVNPEERITLKQILEVDRVRRKADVFTARISKLPQAFTAPKKRPPTQTNLCEEITFFASEKTQTSDNHEHAAKFEDDFTCQNGHIEKNAQNYRNNTIFIDCPIDKGYAKCTLALGRSNGSAYVGVSAYPTTKTGETWLGENPESLRYSFYGKLTQNGRWISGNDRWQSNEEITFEVDMNKRTLHIFKNGTLQPISFTDIPEKIVFGFCLVLPRSTCEVVSLVSMDGPSPDIERGVEGAKTVKWNTDSDS
ncbi:putative Protein kinase domain containing protein [Blattamonas nauphoetae]|uniref:non-specific serine/threonine protein kinase n=1 Tax=Blattamonas nauphoetae TaxID=2049346 RepID=A0ABQ9YHV0_9EUKA|nr:putative Protein kinase domain containing protein [Blattamonas nauphoetae]